MSVGQTTKSAVAKRPRMGERLPTRPRLRGQALLGGMLILLCALIAAFVFVRAGDRVSVVTVNKDVAVGQELTSSDLASTQVAGVDNSILYNNRDELIGKITTVGLVSGQILSAPMVTADPVPGPGKSLAGLSLTKSQIPGTGVEAGDIVRLVKVSNPETVTGEVGAATPLVPAARVYAVQRPDGNAGESTTSVAVVIPQGNADAVASAAAAGQVAVLKMPAGAGDQ